MRLRTLVALTALALALAWTIAPLVAAEPEKKAPAMSAEEQKMMAAFAKAATPGEHHKKLEELIGTWDAKVSYWEKPGAPPQVSTGTSEMTWMLGNRFVQQTFKGESMGQPFEGVGYSGYDNSRGKYIGVWFDTMSTGMMTSEGTFDPSGKVLTLHAEFTDPLTLKKKVVKAVSKMVSPTQMVYEMYDKTPDGKEFKDLEIVYTKK